jgi:hypothetical protein
LHRRIQTQPEIGLFSGHEDIVSSPFDRRLLKSVARSVLPAPHLETEPICNVRA